MYDANNFGLNDDYEYHEMCIDSADSTNAFSTTYSRLNWPKITLGKPLDNVVAIKVLQVIVPKTYYVFNSSNNTFGFYRYQTSGVGWQVNGIPSITPGNYTIAEMLLEIDTRLEACFTGWTITSLPNQLKMNYYNNAGTGTSRYFLLSFIDTTQTFEGRNNNGRNNPREALGWVGNAGTIGGGLLAGSGLPISVYRGSNVFPFSTGIPKQTDTPNVIQLEGPKYIYLNSKTIGPAININLNGYAHMIPANTGGTGPQICKIPVDNTPFGGNIIYSDPDPQKWFHCPLGKLPSQLDFYLTLGVDDPTIPLDLNGASFIVKLGIITSKQTIERDFSSTTVGSRITKMIKTK